MSDSTFLVAKSYSEGCVRVEVSRSEDAIPRYGIRIGWQSTSPGNNKRGPWLPVTAKRTSGGTPYAVTVAGLVAQAEAYIAGRLEADAANLPVADADKIEIRVDDAETRALWETAKKAAAEVASWPAWKK